MGNVSIVSVGPGTQGTKVRVDGVAVKGITRIELIAEVNSNWRAVIHVIPEIVELTDLDSSELEFVKIGPKPADPPA